MTDIIWKINNVVFSEKKQALLVNNNSVQLEPRQAELLSYFCQYPNKLISRDELIKHVWQGQVVTDNAVNRVIAKLRKSLGDDAKNTEFIQTLPRKGYKFIADTRLREAKQPILLDNVRAKYGLAIALILGLFVILLIGLFSERLIEQTEIKGVQVLTRAAGEEFDAAISPNGEYLSYISEKNHHKKLYVKNISQDSTVALSDDQGDAGAASWSQDNARLIYIYNNDKVCQVRLISLSQGQLIGQEILHNCPLGSHGKVVFSHDENKIIYSEKQSGEQPYYLYMMALDTGLSRKLKQPPTFNAGHITFDLHPIEDKLLLSTPDQQQWLAFYLIDFKENKLTHLFNKDDYICCAIFNDKGNKIVVMGPHPAYSLVDMDMDGDNLRTIYNATHRVGPPQRIRNSEDYVYSGGYLNFDIDFFAFDTGTTSPIADSSVIDRLPTLSFDGANLAYISRQTGSSQIWTANLVTGKHKLLTKFNDHQMYQDLLFSPDGTQLAALLNYGVKLVETSNGDSRRLKIPQQVVRGLSWRDQHTLAYSIEIDGQWQVQHYNITQDKVTTADQKWAYISYTKKPHQSVYINHSGELHIGGKVVKSAPFNAIDHHRVFNFKVVNGNLYYRPYAPLSWDIYQLELATMINSRRLSTNNAGGISISDKGIYFTRLENRRSDVFRSLD
jgi:DNA-binding winged helix-turn-helix (wHTH) protein/Tol biopolymer transport system component